MTSKTVPLMQQVLIDEWLLNNPTKNLILQHKISWKIREGRNPLWLGNMGRLGVGWQFWSKMCSSKMDSAELSFACQQRPGSNRGLCPFFYYSLIPNGCIFNFDFLILFKWFAVKTSEVGGYFLDINGRILFHCFYCSWGTIVTLFFIVEIYL